MHLPNLPAAAPLGLLPCPHTHTATASHLKGPPSSSTLCTAPTSTAHTARARRGGNASCTRPQMSPRCASTSCGWGTRADSVLSKALRTFRCAGTSTFVLLSCLATHTSSLVPATPLPSAPSAHLQHQLQPRHLHVEAVQPLEDDVPQLAVHQLDGDEAREVVARARCRAPGPVKHACSVEKQGGSEPVRCKACTGPAQRKRRRDRQRCYHQESQHVRMHARAHKLTHLRSNRTREVPPGSAPSAAARRPSCTHGGVGQHGAGGERRGGP